MSLQSESTSTISSEEIDFRPFGQIVGKDITYEELDRKIEEYLANIKEPQERPDCHFGFPMIKNILPLEDIQSIIIQSIHDIKQNYQELLLADKKIYEEEEIENGFARPLIREHPIKSLEIDIVNPFYWVLNVTHSDCEYPNTIDGRIYGIDGISNRILDNRLYVKISIIIFRSKECDGFDGHFVYVNRLKGRSPVYRDLYNKLTETLEEKEKEKENMSFVV